MLSLTFLEKLFSIMTNLNFKILRCLLFLYQCFFLVLYGSNGDSIVEYNTKNFINIVKCICSL